MYKEHVSSLSDVTFILYESEVTWLGYATILRDVSVGAATRAAATFAGVVNVRDEENAPTVFPHLVAAPHSYLLFAVRLVIFIL